ncbi:MAG: sigma-70 family RNA polymerase sigma factor [Opitutae bacterium]|nr:sigma-70 family RNA polymerase sigma factor [Opitutae bacterium]
MNPDPANDRVHWQALQSGDDTALNRLIARWERPLLAFAWRYVQDSADARDLVAETFVRLYQQRQRLRPDTNLSAWLFTTLTNLCHNQHRWRQRHPTVSLDNAGLDQANTSAMPDETPTPDEALLHNETMAALGAAIAELPHDLKTTLLLHHYEGLSYREVGAVLGCSERGVETRLYRAKQRLRLKLTDVLRTTVTT